MYFMTTSVFSVTQLAVALVLLSDSRSRDRKSTAAPFFFSSAAEAALAGMSALVPVGSASELSHKRTELQRTLVLPFPESSHVGTEAATPD